MARLGPFGAKPRLGGRRLRRRGQHRSGPAGARLGRATPRPHPRLHRRSRPAPGIRRRSRPHRRAGCKRAASPAGSSPSPTFPARPSRKKPASRAMRRWPRPPCAAGYLHLLLGHHAADQAETVAMRLARGPHGAEGIAAWSARNKIVLLRPLLDYPAPPNCAPISAARTWNGSRIPSNQNPKFERVRIRQAGTTAPARRPRSPPSERA